MQDLLPKVHPFLYFKQKEIDYNKYMYIKLNGSN